MREYGSEHPAIILPDGYFAKFSELGREITYLRSGREALLFVGLCAKPSGDATVLVPAYCCWSMSAPFEKAGWRVVYYRLNEDLTVDEDYLEGLLNKCHPAAILTMNYYGSASTKNAVALAKSKGLAVIEDFSHCTFCIRDIFDVNVDYYVSSIRKSVGVCDGAVILSKSKMNGEHIQDAQGDFSQRRSVAQASKSRYSYSKNASDKQFFLGEIRACEEELDAFNSVLPISDLAKQQIDQLNCEEIAYARRDNMQHLLGLLNGNIKMVPGLERSFAGAPFSLPVIVDNRDEVQRRLAQNGVYAPVLWPICDEARRVCSVAAKMADNMLSLPVDQRYGWDDIEDIAKIVSNNL